MITNDQLEVRALAAVVTVAEDRHDDVDVLLSDLTPTQTATMVAGLAALALRCWLPSAAASLDPVARHHAARLIRRQLLDIA
ncbi:hypothetical protein ACFV2D_37720 [Streptomyces capillispiralis]|uniref:hypothetical protein n=1 Tax=Streptomyces capillispiralis TaxID=68182 RepID=UPI003674D053